LAPKDIPATVSEAFSNLRLSDQLPELVADASSVLEADIQEAIPHEDQPGAQNPQPRISTTPSLLGKTAQPTIRSYSQETIDNKLIKEMSSTIPRGGYVNIFKSPNGKLVKIGNATDVNLRKQQIQAGCQLKDLDQVRVSSIYVEHPERVTRLVHLELLNFGAKIPCHRQHGAGREAVEQEHREWFDVSESVAVESVQVWRDFADHAYTSEGILKENWANWIAMLAKPGSIEIDLLEQGLGDDDGIDAKLHHLLRSGRYRTWISACNSPS
jgi:hypothetical protein